MILFAIIYNNSLFSLNLDKKCLNYFIKNNNFFLLDQNFEKTDLLSKNEEEITLLSENRFNFYIKNIKILKEKKISKRCLIKKFLKEVDLILELQENYFLILERNLQVFLENKNLYNKDKILIDFQNNKKTLLESHKKRLKSLLNLILDSDSKINDLKLENSRKWNRTYYVLLYTLFFNLPEEFKKEWFKKIP